MSNILKAIKKPVEIEAILFEKKEDLDDIKSFCGNMFVSSYIDRRSDEMKIEVNTEDGITSASIGDYIIKFLDKNKFSVKTPNTFKATYDIIEEKN